MMTRVLAEGFTMLESGRWHDGRLWMAHWGSGEILALDLDGRVERMARLAAGQSADEVYPQAVADCDLAFELLQPRRGRRLVR